MKICKEKQAFCVNKYSQKYFPCVSKTFPVLQQNSLCFPCLEKVRTKFPVFPVPWPPCFFFWQNFLPFRKYLQCLHLSLLFLEIFIERLSFFFPNNFHQEITLWIMHTVHKNVTPAFSHRVSKSDLTKNHLIFPHWIFSTFPALVPATTLFILKVILH